MTKFAVTQQVEVYTLVLNGNELLLKEAAAMITLRSPLLIFGADLSKLPLATIKLSLEVSIFPLAFTKLPVATITLPLALTILQTSLTILPLALTILALARTKLPLATQINP